MRILLRGFAALLLVVGNITVAAAQDPFTPTGDAAPILRVEFHTKPGMAEIWRSDGEGNSNYLGRSGRPVVLALDTAEAKGARDLIVNFRVPLWFSTWTSPAEYIKVTELRGAGRFPISGGHRLDLTPAQRLQATTRAYPVVSAVALGCPALLLLCAVWYGKRRRPAEPGTALLDGYTLGERIGAGAMGEVYAAQNAQGEECALKFLRLSVGATSSAAAERFDREIAASIELSHPNLLAVYGYGHTSDGRLYLASERLHGTTLKEALKERSHSPPELALEVVEQIGSALSYLHDNGVAHRDVKPENIFVRDGGDNDLVLMDLGIAQTRRQQSLTTDGKAMGSPAYMSPEQVRGKPELQSDQYSLGIVVYEILAGRRPFGGVDVSAVAHQQIHQAAEPPSKLEPRIPAAAEAAILRMLAKDAAARFATVGDARIALGEALLDQHWQR